MNVVWFLCAWDVGLEYGDTLVVKVDVNVNSRRSFNYKIQILQN